MSTSAESSPSVSVDLFLRNARLPQSLYLFSEELFTELGSCKGGVTILKQARRVSEGSSSLHLPNLGRLEGRMSRVHLQMMT